MTTDKSHWHTLTKEELIQQCIEFDKEIDDVMAENATLRDENFALQISVNELTGA
jgi:hypothetical protein